MIDTKIACQCGNRFKFGMDLVNGRAPDGLVCPTCGAPATPACNALVDFLAGKEPPPGGAGSRPLKEIRVICACGARYKFDLELAEKEMPGAVTCPSCQADLTASANEEIRSYIAKHPLNADTSAAAPAPTAPTPAPALAPTTPTTPPAVAQPVLPPTLTASAATAATAAPPAAAPPATPPPPAASTAPAVPPPATTPAATPAVPAASGPVVTPIEDPFGPAPAAKSSGPNLKPLEVPRPNRPPPGSRPATPPAGPAATAPAATKPAPAKQDAAKSEAAKPGAKPAAKPVAKPASREPNFGLGVGGAAGGATIGAVIWFIILKSTPMTASWMAIVVGVLAGGAARLLGRGGSQRLGSLACVCSALTIGLMVWVGMLRYSDRQAEKMLDTQYKQAVADAQMAIKADDAQLKLYISRTRPSADLEGNLITAADIQKFRATELPKLKDRAAGSAADRNKFYSERIAAYRAAQAWDEVWQETFGIFGLLLALAGIMVPAKLAG